MNIHNVHTFLSESALIIRLGKQYYLGYSISMLSIPLTKLIHEKMSIVLTYCFSHQSLMVIREKLLGEWKYIEKMFFNIPEIKSNEAIIEIALLIRMLNEQEKISESFKGTAVDNFGKIEKADGTKEILTIREFSNKIIHAEELQWDLVEKEKPMLICISRVKESWKKAEVDIVALAAFCGRLMS